MAEDQLLQEAIEALRRGDRARAKEILTGLLQTDQNNPDYWVWMSATVESARERAYCLQMALRLAPDNVAAKRGLVLLGALPPDETVTPFPLNRPRAWEQELTLAHEQPRKKGLRAFFSSPAGRLIALLTVGALACALISVALWAPRAASSRVRTPTPGPSPTFSPTPTLIVIAGRGTPTPTFTGPTPLSMLLPEPYTPTPLYVNTPHSVVAKDTYRSAINSYREGNWAVMIEQMQQVATVEAGMADPYYYIGEGNRFLGEYDEALAAYGRALEINPSFGPAYLGRARVALLINPQADVLNDLNRAVQYAPDFAEAYLARAAFLTDHDQPVSALADLDAARAVNPDSPQLYVELARVNLALDRPEEAVQAAERANELDMTLLDAYLVLGQAYVAAGRAEDAIGPMQTYNLYRPGNHDALVVLAASYNAQGRYGDALQAAQTVIDEDYGNAGAWLQRGLAYLGLGNGLHAEASFKTYVRFEPRSFIGCLGWGRALYLQNRYGDAYYQFRSCKSMALSDADLAQYYYWSALSQEQISRLDDAAADWRALLALPAGAATPEMVQEAQAHLAALGR